MVTLNKIALDLLKNVDRTPTPAWIIRHFKPEAFAAWNDLVVNDFVLLHGENYLRTEAGREYLWDEEDARITRKRSDQLVVGDVITYRPARVRVMSIEELPSGIWAGKTLITFSDGDTWRFEPESIEAAAQWSVISGEDVELEGQVVRSVTFIASDGLAFGLGSVEIPFKPANLLDAIMLPAQQRVRVTIEILDAPQSEPTLLGHAVKVEDAIPEELLKRGADSEKPSVVLGGREPQRTGPFRWQVADKVMSNAKGSMKVKRGTQGIITLRIAELVEVNFYLPDGRICTLHDDEIDMLKPQYPATPHTAAQYSIYLYEQFRYRQWVLRKYPRPWSFDSYIEDVVRAWADPGKQDECDALRNEIGWLSSEELTSMRIILRDLNDQAQDRDKPFTPDEAVREMRQLLASALDER